MQLRSGHVACDAVSCLPRVLVSDLSCGGIVAGMAACVVERGVVAAGILVREVASGAGELARCDKTPALHQPEWLKTHVLELMVVDGWFVPVTRSAEFDLLQSREIARIERFTASERVFRCARMAAFALHSWRYRLPIFRNAARGVAGDALFKRPRALP